MYLEQNEHSLSVQFDESWHMNKPVQGPPQSSYKNILKNIKTFA